VVSAAIQPVVGRTRIVLVMLQLARRLEEGGTVEFRWLTLNSAPAIVVLVDGLIHSTLQLDAAEGLIKRIYVVSNPDKLRRLALVGGCAAARP